MTSHARAFAAVRCGRACGRTDPGGGPLLKRRALLPAIATALAAALSAALVVAAPQPSLAATTVIQDTAVGSGAGQVEYTGSSWTRCGGCSVSTPDSSYYYGYTVGDSYTIRFHGLQLDVYAPDDTAGGIATVSVDGVPAGTVDFATSGTAANGLRWSSGVLPEADHTVVFTITSETTSGANVVLLDRAEVTDSASPSPSAPPVSTEPSAPPGHLGRGDHQLLGAGVEDPYEFGQWLGRPVQVWQTWNNFPDWTTMENVPPAHLYFTGEGGAPFDRPFPGRMSIGQPLFAADETVADCASGGDDVHYRAIALALKGLGFGDSIIRLGWEQNGDWVWWHATTENAADWASCFRHAYGAFKYVDRRFVIEWNPNKSTDMPGFDTRLSYPGDEWVDLIGVDFYDQYPPYPDQAAWDANYTTTENGGSPVGIGSWIAFARSHKKQIDFPEWGLNAVNDPAHPDNEFFINKMADTFASLGPRLFEQSYFSLPAGPACNFEIHVDGCNPAATAAYLQRFGGKKPHH